MRLPGLASEEAMCLPGLASEEAMCLSALARRCQKGHARGA